MSALQSIGEPLARTMIQKGLAGYWEPRLDRAISKNPIPHEERVCVRLSGEWYLIPTPEIQIKPHGYVSVGTPAGVHGDLRAHASTVSFSNRELMELVSKHMASAGIVFNAGKLEVDR